MYIFFDTETNGLPKNYNGKPTDLENWPRVIQLAFIVTDTDFNELYRFCELITPDGWTIPVQKFWIDNGYNTKKNADEGKPMSFALSLLCEHINKCTHAFAHNMTFDYPIIAAEMIRYKVKPSNQVTKVCTMKSSTNFCALPKNKWPKLEELHQILFNEGFDDAHDALADVSATVKCARELVKKGIINL